MVVSQTQIDLARLNTLTQFDSISHIGFSDDNSAELPSANTLTGEFVRKALSVAASKDTVQFTEEFEAVLGLTENNGETLNKIGLFTDLAGNTLIISKVLDTGIAKTADREINVAYQVSVEVVDLT